jgi:hypothetical protein
MGLWSLLRVLEVKVMLTLGINEAIRILLTIQRFRVQTSWVRVTGS